MKQKIRFILFLNLLLGIFSTTLSAYLRSPSHQQFAGEENVRNYGTPAMDNPDYYYAAIKSAASGISYYGVGFNPLRTKIVANKDDGAGYSEIVIMNADGTGEVVISPGDSGTGDIVGYWVPFWSDNGTAVGFVEIHSSNPNKVILYDVSSGTRSYFYEPVGSDVCNPDFLGNSTSSIVFWDWISADGAADLFTWDGTTLTNITNSTLYSEYEPVSNNDGSVILYWSGETITEPVNTTHTLTYTGGSWVKDVGFTAIADTYWGFWSGQSNNNIGVVIPSTHDVHVYDNTGSYMFDVTGPGYVGGAAERNYMARSYEGNNGEILFTSNAGRTESGRDIIIANPRDMLFVDVATGSDSNPGTSEAPFLTITKAITEAADGGIINVAAGTYTEDLTIDIGISLVGAGTSQTIINPTASGNVAITVSADDVTIQDLKISHDTKYTYGIQITDAATSGLTLEYVDFTNLGNNAGWAYGIKFSDSFNGLTVSNCNFIATETGTLSYVVGIKAPNDVNLSNFEITNSSFEYNFIGIFFESAIDGFTVSGNTFGPFEVEDCTSGTAGIYIGDGADNNFDIENVEIMNNTFTSYSRGVYVWNYANNATVSSFNVTGNTFTNSIWSSAIRFIAGIGDNEGVSFDGITVSNNTLTQNSDVGGNLGLIDFRTYCALAACDIDVTDNDITLSGSTYTDAIHGIMFFPWEGPFTNTLVDNNTLDGGDTAGAGTPLSSGIAVLHKASTYWPAGTLEIDVTNNAVTAFDNGICVYDLVNSQYGGLPTGCAVDVHTNDISGNNVYGVQSGTGEFVDATYNYWGPNGPVDLVVGNVLYIPWYADAEMTTLDGNPVTNLTQNTGYTTIQAAIDAANAGDVIEVAAGTYQENLTIGTELTLIKNGSSLPVIEVDDGVAIFVTTDNVTINGFEIKHTTVDGEGDIGIRLQTADNCIVKNCEIESNSLGIMLYDSSYNNLQNNLLDSNVIGIYFEGETELSTYNDVTNNTISNSPQLSGQGGQGIYLDQDCDYNDFQDNTITDNDAIGIYFWKASNNTIINNTISGNTEQGIQLMGSSSNTITDNTITSNEIGLQLRCGALSTTDNIINNNTISNNATGITFEDDVSTNNYAGFVSGNTVKYNEISGNTSYGVSLSDTPIAQHYDVTKNYWGAADGPVHSSNPLGGSGNAVSDNVDFMPWYATATTTPATEFATLNSEDGSRATIEVFTSDELANALANAVDGDEIILGSGTFTGNFVVDDDITITAADGAVPTIVGSDDGPALTINADGVSVSGLNIEADDGDEAVVISNSVSDGATISVTSGSILAGANLGVVNNSTNNGEVDATSNYWGDPDPSGYVVGNVNYGDPIVNDPVQISVSPATQLVTGGEEAQYDVNIGVVDEIRAFQIDIMMDKTDFDAPVEGDFTLGSLLSDAATAAGTITQFEVDDLTEAGDNYYTYQVTGSILGVASAQVTTGNTGQLFYLDLTSSTGVTNLDGSNLSLGFIYARDETNGAIPCEGMTNGIVTIDSVVPVIDDITEAENGYYATAPVISSLGYSDNYNVDKFYYQIDVTTGSWSEITGTASGTIPGTTWTPDADWTVPGFAGLSEGSHTVYFRATDQAGNNSADKSWQFNKDTSTPDALVWKVDGNKYYPITSVDSNNSIDLDWVDPTGSYSYIHIWRKAYSDFGTNTGYPEYTGTAPSGTIDLPADPKAATDPTYGWTKITKADITSFTNTISSRGYYYYAIYVEGLNGLASDASVVSPALSYWLGDVNDTPDGEVTSADIALFSAAWNTNPTGSILDVGPTADNSRNALPLPDNAIDFEDLMIFAMNYENTDYTYYRVEYPFEPVPIEIELEYQQVEDEIIAYLTLFGNTGFVKGVSIPIEFTQDLTFISTTTGDIWPDGTYFDYRLDENVLEISGSVLGGNSCLEESGLVAEVHFQMEGTNIDLSLGYITARDIYNNELEITNNATDNDSNIIIPVVNSLGNNYPNPFNPSTTIAFGLKQEAKVSLMIYNIKGQKVKTLVNEVMPAGNHTVVWYGKTDNEKAAASGVYFYKMQTADYVKIRKAILLK